MGCRKLNYPRGLAERIQACLDCRSCGWGPRRWTMDALQHWSSAGHTLPLFLQAQEHRLRRQRQSASAHGLWVQVWFMHRKAVKTNQNDSRFGWCFCFFERFIRLDIGNRHHPIHTRLHAFIYMVVLGGIHSMRTLAAMSRLLGVLFLAELPDLHVWGKSFLNVELKDTTHLSLRFGN